MLPRVMLMLSFIVAGASAGAAMSECQSECEKTYKYCVDKRATSEKTCRVGYEKCRRACAKKDGKTGPG